MCNRTRRSRRAISEFRVDGMPTALTFDAVVLNDPAYVASSNPTGEGEFTVYTTWIETDFDNQIPPYSGGSADVDEPGERQNVTVEVGGRHSLQGGPIGTKSQPFLSNARYFQPCGG